MNVDLVDWLRLSNGTAVKVWGPPWREGRVLWKWNEDDLVCIQLDGQRLGMLCGLAVYDWWRMEMMIFLIGECMMFLTTEYALTFHAEDPKWRIEILKDKPRDCRDIQPPLQFVMAKRKHLALDTMTVNTGLLVLSSDSDSDYEQVDDPEEEQEVVDENQYIELLDLTAVTGSKRRRRQRLNKVKIVKMQKNKLQRVTSKRKKKRRRRKHKRGHSSGGHRGRSSVLYR